MNRRLHELAEVTAGVLGGILGLLVAGLLLPITTIGPYPLTYEGLTHADPGLWPAATVVIPGVIGFLVAVAAWDLLVERRPPWRRSSSAAGRPRARWPLPVATFSTWVVVQMVKHRFDYTTLLANDAETEYQLVIQPMDLALVVALTLGAFLAVYIAATLIAETIGARSPTVDTRPAA
jgi:hypothetical protein